MLILYRLWKTFLKFVYIFIKMFPTKNKITLISRQSNKPSIDLLFLKQEINKQISNYDVVVLAKKLEGKEKASIINKIKYNFHIFKQMYNIATSKVVILDSYCIPISILKQKKKLKIIQMWHSIGTMKKFGYSIVDKEEGNNSKISKLMNMHKNYNYILISSEEYKKDIMEGFSCEESKIKIIPLPRVDLLLDETYITKTIRNVKKVYPDLCKKKNILYVPTFRESEFELEKAVKKLINNIDYKKYNLIVKLHPNSKIEVDDDKICLASSFSSIDMLFLADYVISDYSCIIYEAGLLKKPIYIYAFDIDEYKNKRDLRIDLKNDFPGFVSEKPEEIIKKIEKNEYNIDEIYNFTKKYVKVPKKGCTNKIIELIKEIVERT